MQPAILIPVSSPPEAELLQRGVSPRWGARELAKHLALPGLLRERPAPETVATGIAELDALTGGVPRGALTEIFGRPSSGRTSLLLSLMAACTRRGEVCAWVDASDAFDPHSAAAAGVELERLLWVRCRNLERALRATDLLLGAGGFGLVVMDLGDIAPRQARRIPLTSWFRFRRAVEPTPTVLVALEQEPCAGSCASLALRLEPAGAHCFPAPQECAPAHACLLRGLRVRAEVVRSRLHPARPPRSAAAAFALRAAWAG